MSPHEEVRNLLEQGQPVSLDDTVRQFEATLIESALKATHGNKSRAAALLRIKRSTLGDRINRCGLRSETASAPAEATS